jgi:hypothetical protein
MNLLFFVLAAAVVPCSLGCAGSPWSHVAQPFSAAGEHPCAVRAEAGVLWASAGVWAKPRRVWEMPAGGAVEQLQVVPMPGDAGYVVTFRQGGVRWWGELDASRAGRGQLRQVLPPPDTIVAATR